MPRSSMMWKQGSLPYQLDPAGLVAFAFFLQDHGNRVGFLQKAIRA